jgi:hypothetical protein
VVYIVAAVAAVTAVAAEKMVSITLFQGKALDILFLIK